MNEIDEFGNPITNQQNADRYAPLSIDEFGNPVAPTPTPAPAVNPEATFAPTLSKAEYLASRKAQKTERLKARAGLTAEDMSDNYGELAGAQESFANKIVNDYTPAELEYITTRMNDEYGLVYTNKGYMRQDADGNFTPFEGDTSTYGTYYEFMTKDGNNKLGVWGGIDPRGRYFESYLKNRRGVGEKGVDVDQLTRSLILPVSMTGLLEGLRHGNKYYLENRLVRDYRPNGEDRPLPEYYENRDAYGSGMTEMYRPFAKGELPEGYDREALWRDFTQKYRPEQRGALTEQEELDYYNELARRRLEGVNNKFINRFFNTAAGAGAAVTDALVVGTADLVGDVTGLYDIGTDEENRKMVNEWFGYDSTNADKAAEEAKKHVTKMYEAYKNDEPIDMEDMYKAISAGATMELAVTSIAETLVLFFGVGGITRTGKAIRTVDKQYKAAMAAATTPAAKEAAKEAAKNAVKQIKTDATLMDSAKFFAASNAGYINQVAVTTNHAVDEFKANNNGEVGPSDIVRIAAVNSFALGVDRFAGAIVLKDVPGVPASTETLKRLLPGGANVSSKERSKAIKDVVAQMTPEEYRKVLAPVIATISYAGKVAGSAGTEALTEYAQTLAEVFNEQYATEKYGSDFAKILASDEAQIRALTGAAIGAGTGGGITATTAPVGGVVRGTVNGVRRINAAAQEKRGNTSSGLSELADDFMPETSGLEQPVSAEAKEEQRLADKELYSAALNRLFAEEKEKSYAPEKLADYINDLETLKRTRYSLTDSTPENLEKADAALRLIENSVANLVKNHPDGKIKFSSVLSDSTTLGARPGEDALPPKVRKAIIEAVTDVIYRTSSDGVTDDYITKLKALATTNDVNTEVVDKVLLSYESVADEALRGDRGVEGRSRTLDLLLNSGNVSAAAVRQQYNEATKFYVTTIGSISALQDGITEAKKIAASKNKSVTKDANTEAVPVTTTYMTNANSTSEGRPFVIYVRYKDGQWEADIGEAEKRIKAKKETASGLRGLLNKFTAEASDYLDSERLLPIEEPSTPKDPSATDVDAVANTSSESTTEVNESVESVDVPDSGVVNTTTTETTAAVNPTAASNTAVETVSANQSSAAQKQTNVEGRTPSDNQSTQETQPVKQSVEGKPEKVGEKKKPAEQKQSEAPVKSVEKKSAVEGVETSTASDNTTVQTVEVSSVESDTETSLEITETTETTENNTEVVPTGIQNNAYLAKKVLDLIVASTGNSKAVEQEAVKDLRTAEQLAKQDFKAPEKTTVRVDKKEKARINKDKTIDDLSKETLLAELYVKEVVKEVLSNGLAFKLTGDSTKDFIGFRKKLTAMVSSPFIAIAETYGMERSDAYDMAGAAVKSAIAETTVDTAEAGARAKEIEKELERTDEERRAVSKRLETKSKLARLALEEILLAEGKGSKTAEQIQKELMEVAQEAKVYFTNKEALKISRTIAPLSLDTLDSTEISDDMSDSEKDSILASSAVRNNVTVVLTQEVQFPVTGQSSQNIRRYMEAVKEAVFESTDDVVELYGEGVTRESLFVNDIVEALEAHDKKTEEVTESWKEGWKEVTDGKLQGNALIGAINQALKKVGMVVRSKYKAGENFTNTLLLRNEGEKLLRDAVGSASTKRRFSLIGTTPEGKTVSYIRDAIPQGVRPGSVITINKEDITVVTINEIAINPNTYLEVGKTTLLNTLPMKYLPKVFTENAAKLKEVMMEEVSPLTTSEVRGWDVDKTGKGNMYWAAESPARTLMFSKDGSLSDTFVNALNVALAEVMYTESTKLAEGKKDMATVARIFNVPEFEVTEDMIDIADNYGIYAKTVANMLGTKVLSSLGYRGKNETEASKGHYERMATDIGNVGIELLTSMGAIQLKSISSSKLDDFSTGEFAEHYIDESTGSEVVTWFVSIPMEETEQGVRPSQEARRLADMYREMQEFGGDVTGTAREPYFGSIDKKTKEEYLSSVRNSLVDGAIPEEGKETLNSFMDTPYSMDLEGVKAFLDMLDNEDLAPGIMKSLGYVSTNSFTDEDGKVSYEDPAYAEMLYDEKLTQTAINDGIERSITHLRNAYERISSGKVPNEMYFGFYYTTNHRYMMDSTTINPQTDKLHRFFIQPSAHKDTYKVNRRNNTFSAEVTKDGATTAEDVSLYVRAALAQAFGVGIDKENTLDIIDVGNVILSISEGDLKTLRDDMIKNQKVTLTSNGKEYTFKLDHVSHFLTAVKFLEDFHQGKGTVTSSLTAETDALTSGFSNKIQQYAYFSVDPSALETHARRVGVVKNKTTLKRFDNTENIYGVNDLLAEPDSVDSYQNLGIQVLEGVEQILSLKEKAYLADDLFGKIRDLIPGGDQIGKENKVVTKPLRNLFKPAFMIFNYSAGINRIVANTTNEMAMDVLRKIAKADLSNKESAEYVAAEAISKFVGVTPENLQRMIRTKPLVSIVFDVKRVVDGEKVTVKTNILEFVQHRAIKPTYGAAIKNIFESNFEYFSTIQDTTNDAFKLVYEVFNAHLLKAIKEYRGDDNKPVTETVFKDIVKSLHKKFPVIAGPLSRSLEDGIYIYGSSTKTPDDSLNFTAHAVGKFSKRQRKLNPIIRSMVAAANSGSVLPFHAIDGAQLGRTAIEFMETYEIGTKGSGMTPIHDAVMPALKYLDRAAYIYNKNTVGINKEYSVLRELAKMMDTLASDPVSIEIMEKLDPVETLKIRTITHGYEAEYEALKKYQENLQEAVTLEEKRYARMEYKRAAKEVFSFIVDAGRVHNHIAALNRTTENGRAEFYKNGDKVGVMVGLAPSVYTVGDTDINTDMLKNLERHYVNKKVVYGTVDPDAVSAEMVDVYENATTEKMKLPKAGNGNKWGSKAIRSKYAESVFGDGKKVTKGTVVLPEVADKTDVDQREIENDWMGSLEEAQHILNSGGVILFSDVAALNEDALDPLTGELFVFSRLSETNDYNVVQVDLEGELVNVMSSKAYEAADSTPTVRESSSVEAAVSGIIEPHKTKPALTEKLGRLKELGKRCK